MVITKELPEYVALDPNFKPLPRNSHYKKIDPEFGSVKSSIDAAIDQVWEPSLSLEAFRKAWLNHSAPSPGCPMEGEDVTTATQQIPVRDGATIEVKTYVSRDRKPGSALVMRYHGGGWVVGGHCTEHPENLVIAGRTNSVVVSVDYSMAPEYKFPYAANDCLDALKWAKANAKSLGADPEKIIITGGSAAANLGITGVVGQVLSFPVTCHPECFPTDKYELASYNDCADASVVNPVRVEWFLDAYMPGPTPDWRFSSLLAPLLKGLPPALFLVAGFDIFRDEGIAYAERLQSEGVDVDLRVYQGLPHCFYMLPAHPKTVDYYERIIGFIKKHSG